MDLGGVKKRRVLLGFLLSTTDLLADWKGVGLVVLSVEASVCKLGELWAVLGPWLVLLG